MLEQSDIGATGERSLMVDTEHTAVQWGSGALNVLATPQMIALMEGAAVDAVDHLLPEGYQTVGIHLDVRHLAATPMGRRVTARAELITVDDRRLVFRVQAADEAGKIGEGTHERFIVQVQRFLERAKARGV